MSEAAGATGWAGAASPVPLQCLSDVPFAPMIGVIVSLNTRVFTTLAVASAARYLGIPLLIVECESTDGSYETLSRLVLPTQAWIVRSPKQIHGVLIDRLMRELKSTRVVLIDSDVEVRDAIAFRAMQAAMDVAVAGEDVTYAAGWAHGDHDMSNDTMPHAWFPRRPWIPFALFDRRICAELIAVGCSFEATEVGNELPVPVLARLLAMRWHVSWARGWTFGWLRGFRKQRRGVSASFYVYDTGALIYEAAEARKLRFGDIGQQTMEASISHFSGATRRTRSERWSGYSAAELPILETLRTSYCIELSPP
jgi:hypothetical protein